MNGRRSRQIRADAEFYSRTMRHLSVKTIARRMRRVYSRNRRYGTGWGGSK